MRKVIAIPIAAAMVIAAGSSAIAASTSSWKFNLKTVVPDTCFIQNGQALGTSNALISAPGTSPTTIDFSQAVNGTTALLSAANATWGAEAMCNSFATQATLASQYGTMYNANLPNVVGGAFLKKVDYTVTGSWVGVGLNQLNANLPPQTPTQSVTQINGAINGNLSLTFAFPASTVPLLAGNYSDVMTLTLFTSP